MDQNVIVYGVEGCEDTTRTRQFLNTRGVPYQYVDLDKDPQADKLVKEANEGKRKTPMVIVQFGTEARKLRVPDNEELGDALRDFEIQGHAA